VSYELPDNILLMLVVQGLPADEVHKEELGNTSMVCIRIEEWWLGVLGSPLIIMRNGVLYRMIVLLRRVLH
jgi:hypothetical protein